jgi:hypothetical protein
MESGEGSRITTEEKNVIMKLVLDRKAVLESKRTDAVSLSSKTKAWKEVEVEFNRHEGMTKVSTLVYQDFCGSIFCLMMQM